MAKSRIIKEMANGTVSLEVTLKRSLLIAYDIGNTAMQNWIQKELSGYNENDQLPEYRKLKGTFKCTYNLFGIKHTDESISPTGLFGDEGENFNIYNCYDNISFLEEACKNQNLRFIETMHLRRKLRKTVDTFYLEIPQSEFSNAIAKVSSELLYLLLSIEKELGILDELDICANEQQKDTVNKIVNNYIGTLINIGDNNEISKSRIGDKNE